MTGDPVPVLIKADDALRGGTIYIRKQGGSWERKGYYTGIPRTDTYQLGNHEKYEIKIENAGFWTIQVGQAAFQPLAEQTGPRGYLIANISANPTPAFNALNVLLKVVLPLLLLPFLVIWGALRRAQDKRKEAERAAEMVRACMTELSGRVLSQTKAQLPTSLQIGSYMVVDLIGDGGMASVYRVRDTSGAVFAMKVPHRAAVADTEFLERFHREISIVSGLQHPNIVRAFDEGEFDAPDGTKVPYLVMEIISGQSLQDILAERSRSGAEPDLNFAIRISRQIADGLAAAHERAVVHRDLKPGNLMITQGQQVKIMDFGIARSLRAVSITQVQNAIGTPEYMAPEQMNRMDVDHRADLYSLGVIMFALLTHKLPFWEADMRNLVIRKLTEAAPSARSQNPAVPVSLDALVARLMEIDPKRRIQTASNVVAAIDFAEKYPDRIPPMAPL